MQLLLHVIHVVVRVVLRRRRAAAQRGRGCGEARGARRTQQSCGGHRKVVTIMGTTSCRPRHARNTPGVRALAISRTFAGLRTSAWPLRTRSAFSALCVIRVHRLCTAAGCGRPTSCAASSTPRVRRRAPTGRHVHRLGLAADDTLHISLCIQLRTARHLLAQHGAPESGVEARGAITPQRLQHRMLHGDRAPHVKRDDSGSCSALKYASSARPRSWWKSECGWWNQRLPTQEEWLSHLAHFD